MATVGIGALMKLGFTEGTGLEVLAFSADIHLLLQK
jgi:hypothetical protein